MVTLLEETYPEYYGYFIYKDKRGRKRMYSESKKGDHSPFQFDLHISLFIVGMKEGSWDV